MSKGTARRTVRIGPLWDEAQAKASENGDNLSDIIREALKQYTNQGDAMSKKNIVISTLKELKALPKRECHILINYTKGYPRVYEWLPLIHVEPEPVMQEEGYYEANNEDLVPLNEIELPVLAIQIPERVLTP